MVSFSGGKVNVTIKIILLNYFLSLKWSHTIYTKLQKYFRINLEINPYI